MKNITSFYFSNYMNEFICKVSPLLPIPQTVKVCNIETKEEINLLTGKEINCLKIGDTLIMTQEVYDNILNKCQKQ